VRIDVDFDGIYLLNDIYAWRGHQVLANLSH
jgi:hypothetical protein